LAGQNIMFNTEWNDTLDAASWTTIGIANQNPPPVAQNEETETLRILIPAGTAEKRFVRLEITGP
jgi:hypothetical protein